MGLWGFTMAANRVLLSVLSVVGLAVFLVSGVVQAGVLEDGQAPEIATTVDMSEETSGDCSVNILPNLSSSSTSDCFEDCNGQVDTGCGCKSGMDGCKSGEFCVLYTDTNGNSDPDGTCWAGFPVPI